MSSKNFKRSSDKPVAQSYVKLCIAGRKCINDNCKYLHPNGKGHCPFDVKCNNTKCILVHPNGKGECYFGVFCFSDECDCKHSEGKNHCKYGSNCKNRECKLFHPEGKIKCVHDIYCLNADCTFSHPDGSGYCWFNHKCVDEKCSLKHISPRYIERGFCESCSNGIPCEQGQKNSCLKVVAKNPKFAKLNNRIALSWKFYLQNRNKENFKEYEALVQELKTLESKKIVPHFEVQKSESKKSDENISGLKSWADICKA